MKTLSKLEKDTIENAMLRNNKTDEQIKQRIEEAERKLNEPKKPSFWNTFDEDDTSGMM